ncbi:uncharacterized protein C8A04DRAFT_9503 [Dichotomopilus funicola]|uniref:N-acetyltransferase domain-containing protein n=1 Tax=Dichotomopilus funicola TaxID=1934379 RepID=A0AAN6V8H0_9PEZI|nr:hypothetical protein C8A04DRAFT_9503 [Dichotomopilus funicola]
MASSVNNTTSSDGNASPGSTDGSSSSSRSSIASSGSSIASVGSGDSVSSTSTAATTPVDESPISTPPFGAAPCAAATAAALNADTKAEKIPALALDVNTKKTTTAIDKIKTSPAAGNAITHSLVPARWKSGSVRTIGMAEHREAALTLAHAFAADDYARYLVVGDGVAPGISGGGGDGLAVDDDKDAASVDSSSEKKRGVRRGLKSDEERKWRLHVDILTYTVASHCLGGLVTAVGPECDSVALWIPPGKHLDGWWTQLRSGLWRLRFQLSAEGRRRYFDEILPRLHDIKLQVLGDRDNEAWYLLYLGTKPNSQGHGYAARLLQDMMARADAENRPMYLESSSLANNVYYAKFGFVVRRDVFLERGPMPVQLSIMVREPGTGRTRKEDAVVPETGTGPVVKKRLGVIKRWMM